MMKFVIEVLMSKHPLSYCTICLFLSLIFIGCARSRGRIVAPTVNYPVSLSPVIRDVDGRILMEDELEVVGDFKYKYTTVHMIWQTIPLTRTKHDISEELEEQIKAFEGEAVTNLTVHGVGNRWNFWSSFIFGLGLLPGYAKFEVQGDIVRRTPTSIEKQLTLLDQ